MINLLKKVVKIGVAGLATYILYDQVFNNEEEKSVEEKEEEKSVEEKTEDIKEKAPVVALMEDEKKEKKTIFRKANIVTNANDVLKTANTAIENANTSIEKANLVMDNANEAIHNINELIWKINKDIELLKRLIFVLLVFGVIYLVL